jgi:hypothetical protein
MEVREDMLLGVEKLTEVRKQIRFISGVIDSMVFPTDSDRMSYLFTELDSLITVLKLSEGNSYKESFIVLRTILEKFLYFWLMFEGIKFRRTIHYTINVVESKNSKEARDKTLKLWKALPKSGDPTYANWNISPGHADDVIIVTFVQEGIPLERNGKETNEVVPYYDIALREYDPDIKHLSGIQDIVNKITADKIVLKQNIMYNHYFHINNIFKNLLMNKLVNNFQINILRIHYNFLSKLVHPSKYGIELWNHVNNRQDPFSPYSGENIRELIILYVTKLTQLYIKIFISGYKGTKNKLEYDKYAKIVSELGDLSKDFWFFDNEPTEFDKRYSEQRKAFLKSRSGKIPDELIYNKDPLIRLNMLRTYGK